MNHRWLDRRIAAPGPYLTLCLNEQQFRKALKHCGLPENSTEFMKTSHADATCHYLNNQSGDLVCIVCLGDHSGRNGIEIAGLLVHEAVHIWQRYAERIGEDRPGDEQEAYAIQAIAQELMAEFARQSEAV
jgi:hypothetical protein